VTALLAQNAPICNAPICNAPICNAPICSAPICSAPICNAMTVDVEDYFQVQAFFHCIDRKDWDAFPRRVDLNTNRILDQFDAAGVKATFFTLGWVA
jgi:hypothetical protein